ncbi:MAG: flagellar hook protein FlgE [Cellulosilyticaceae bacterium]
MMRSMYSGVSGLRVHQTKMDVIGNNIANVNTIGFKSQRVTFNEVFSQTLQSGTAASDETGRGGRNPMQVGLGVNVSSIDTLMTQGAAQRTDNPFDLMIDGDGFLIVGDAAGQYFTRAGALRQDDEGNLVIPNGMKVQGWPANETGTAINRGVVGNIKLNDTSNKTSPPKATTSTSLSGNINIKDTPIESQVKLYDSLGNLYSFGVEMKYDAGTGEWTVDVADSSKDGGNIVLKDKDGKTQNIADTAVTGLPAKLKFDTAGVLTTVEAKDGTKLDLTKGDKPEFKIFGADVALGASKLDGNATLSFSGLTQFNSKTSVDSKTVNGSPAGEMMGFDVGADGIITAYYNNGATKMLGQIVVAQFDNPAGLQKVGDNLFQTTANSGDFDGIGSAGVFQAGVLEMSNVDLSREFTEMIVTQRGFQANSRIISASDEMLQELVNIKR